MPFAVIVLASNTTHWYLVAFGGGVEPRLLDLIKGHHFLTRIIVKYLILLFPFCLILFLCWLFCFSLLTEPTLTFWNHTLVGVTFKSDFLTNAILLLNLDTFSLPLATSL